MLPNIVKQDNPYNPKMASKEGYQESLFILKSPLQDSYLPAEFQPIYKDCKKVLRTRKKLRYTYWSLTYLNPLAPFNAYVNRKALVEDNIVKR